MTSVLARRWLSGTVCGSTSGAEHERGGEVGRGRAPSARTPGRRSGNSAGRVGEERPLDREAADGRVQRRRAARDRLLESGRATLGERAERGVEVAEQRGLRLGDRRDLAGGPRERLDEAGRGASAGRRGSGHHRHEVAQQRASAWIAMLRSRPRPASASPKSGGSSTAASRVFLSKVLKTSSISTGAGVASSSGIVAPSSSEARSSRARGELDVLQAERRARAHEDVRVLGQRLDRRLELHPQQRGDAAVLVALRRDLVDHADAGAADAHVVALDEVRGVGHLGLELVGRHERQAVVRVVGQEHGDDDDEHRRGADQHGVGRHRGCRAGPSWPAVPSR